jgi:hypothetical protein
LSASAKFPGSAIVRAEVVSEGTCLSRAESAFITIVVLAFGCVSILRGEDTGWDFLNYHWYDAYAFLNGRLGFDVAVAHHATYYNPLIHLPFYWLASAGAVRTALFYTGALHGLNILPLYLLARSALIKPDSRWLAFALALAGMFGSTVLSMVGNTSYDTVLCVPVLFGLATLVINRESLSTAPAAAGRAAALAGFLIGMAVGLKAVEISYAVGFALVMLLLPGTPPVRCARLLVGGAAGTAGVLLCAGFWFLTLLHATGNPLFPFYNSVFHSPLIAPTFFGSTNFPPSGFWSTVSFPFQFLLDYRLADDGPFRDLRVPLLYVLIPIASIWFAVARRGAPDLPAAESARLVAPAATRILFIFVAGTYAAWVPLFAVYRYLVGLEMLAPVLILAALDCIPWSPRSRLTTAAMILLAAALFGRYSFGAHSPISHPYVQAQGLSFANPSDTLLLMTGNEPMAYLIPSLPPTIAVLRIAGWLAEPNDGSGLTAAMRARVAAHHGDLFLLEAPSEQAAAERATNAYGLEIVTAQCRQIHSNMGGPYSLCPLHRGPGDLTIGVTTQIPGAELLVFADGVEVGHSSGPLINLTHPLKEGETVLVEQRLGKCTGPWAYRISTDQPTP